MKRAFLLLLAWLPLMVRARGKYSYAEGRSVKIDSTGKLVLGTVTTVWQWFDRDGRLEKQVEH